MKTLYCELAPAGLDDVADAGAHQTRNAGGRRDEHPFLPHLLGDIIAEMSVEFCLGKFGLNQTQRRRLHICPRPDIVVISDHLYGSSSMVSINLKDAKAGFSGLVDEAIKGEFVTITRHGKPVAALVSLEAAEIARKAIERRRSGLVTYLRTFPGGEFERNRSPSRDVEL